MTKRKMKTSIADVTGCQRAIAIAAKKWRDKSGLPHDELMALVAVTMLGQATLHVLARGSGKRDFVKLAADTFDATMTVMRAHYAARDLPKKKRP